MPKLHPAQGPGPGPGDCPYPTDPAYEPSGAAGAWSYLLLARSHGGQAAKDSMTTSISTIGVMAALMITLTLPAVANPPVALQSPDGSGGYQLRYLRPWFWFSLGSTLASITGLVLASLLLTYLTPVPPAGIEAYLERWQGLYVGAIAGFILSVLLQGAALLAAVAPVLPPADHKAAVALTAAVFGGLLALFWRVDAASPGLNRHYFAKWWLSVVPATPVEGGAPAGDALAVGDTRGTSVAADGGPPLQRGGDAGSSAGEERGASGRQVKKGAILPFAGKT